VWVGIQPDVQQGTMLQLVVGKRARQRCATFVFSDSVLGYARRFGGGRCYPLAVPIVLKCFGSK
jgi:N-glycosylase/DNA lyase